MVKCQECGKELKHKGALCGHLAFAHSVRTSKGSTFDEVRNAIKYIINRLTDLETNDLDKQYMTMLSPYFDNFSVMENIKDAEIRSLNEHIKQQHLSKPLLSNEHVVVREDNGSEVMPC